jgi:hypothetical protein
MVAASVSTHELMILEARFFPKSSRNTQTSHSSSDRLMPVAKGLTATVKAAPILHGLPKKEGFFSLKGCFPAPNGPFLAHPGAFESSCDANLEGSSSHAASIAADASAAV